MSDDARRLRLLEQRFEMTAVAVLRPHPKNPREGDLAALRSSLDANGFYGAIVAQRSTGYILAGNHRYQAACQRSADELPVLWVECDDATALRILLADNRTSDQAGYDDAGLAEILRALQEDGGGLHGTGYSEKDLTELFKALDDALPADPEGAGDQSDEIESSFDVIVSCRDEGEQVSLLERLSTEGFRCRALVS